MAEKRMFSKKIIDTDAFLEMPQSTQNLYFHLAMRADDDGFVNNPKRIQRIVGAADDDMRVLEAKRYILHFDQTGVIVIKHWRIHNTIRKDRYTPTLYTDERNSLYLKDNGAYTDHPGAGTVPAIFNDDGTPACIEGCQVVANRLPDGCQVVALDKSRVVEGSVGKDREDISTGSNEPVCRTSDVRRIMAAWNETGLTQVARITADTNRGKMLKARIREYSVEGVLKAIENVKNSTFLKGQNSRGFEATFDWFVKPNNFLKVFEGNYADTASATGTASACAHDGEAYQIALYLAQQKALDNPGRAQPTEAELQKQAEILNTLHLENGVAWKTIDDTLYYALENSWWNKKVQSAYDLKLHFNSIFADMVRDQGAVKE